MAQERIKELTALHRAVRLLRQHNLPLSDILADLATLLPPAFQFPEITSARVVYEVLERTTPGFAPSPWMLTAKFAGGRGRIEVAYIEERPASAEGPFLAEERALLDILAGLLDGFVYRHVSEQDVRQQARMLEAVLSASADRHFLMGRDGRYLYTDEGGARTIGRAREDIIGHTWQEMGFPAEYFLQVDQQNKVVIATGQPVSGEMVFPTPEGPRDFSYILTPVKDESGEVESVLATARDVTASKAADSTRAQLAMAVEQAAESIVITDRDANIVYVNPAFERTTGYTRAEVLGRNPNILGSKQQPAEFYQSMWNRLLAGEHWAGTLVNRRKDGSLFYEEATISPVRDLSGVITNFVAVKRDATHERELEQQIRQAQKMEAVGRLAGGVAHDFNNLLAVILGYGEMVLEQLPAESALRHSLEEMNRAADRAATLTRQLLAFSRQQVLAPQVLDLNVSVREMNTMLHRLIREDVKLITRLDPALGCVRADPSQIEQVIMNLAVNARDAMPGGGQLIVETENVNIDADYVHGHAQVPEGLYVRLSVSDTGHGMDAETQKRIFDPFFTTKPQGQGTGLGLATVYGIVKQSGGFVWVYSEVGRGTTFKIYLPCIDQTASPAGAPAVASEAPRGTETILIAEDSEALREMNHQVLASLDYTVLVARDGDHALQVATDHPGTIHLLVTDMVMPGMGGRGLARRMAALRPGIKTLFMSGYTDEMTMRQRDGEPDLPFLQKPFRPADLARSVRQVLNAAGPVEARPR